MVIIVVVSQDGYCDRIGIINQGKLIAVGTVEEIIAEAGKETLEEAFIVIGTMILPDMVLDMPWLQLPLAWAVGIVLLYIGYRKLSNME